MNFTPADKRFQSIFKFLLNVNKINEIDKWLGQFKKILDTQFTQLDEVLLTLKKQKNEK